jgi:hypothetical protein
MMLPRIYFVRGAGSRSQYLSDPVFQGVIRTIFSGCTVVFDTNGNRSHFLREFFASDLGYMTLHNAVRAMELIIGNGDRVSVAEFQQAYNDRHRPRNPALVIVGGCQSADNTAGDLPSCLGFPGSSRAFIGFRSNVAGFAIDPYFRVFLAHWVKPRPDGSRRTLIEARDDAGSFIRRQLANQSELANLRGKNSLEILDDLGDAAVVQRFSGIAQRFAQNQGAPRTRDIGDIGDQFAIIGNRFLRVTDV